MTPRKRPRRVPTAPPVHLAGARRKTIWVSQSELDTARKELGTATDAETIDRALDMIAFQREARDGLEEMTGRGGFVNYFDDAKSDGI